MKNDEHIVLEDNEDNPHNIYEQCKNEEQSVTTNLITNSYKICDSCKMYKTIVPVEIT